jgi:hypothetical protein
MKTPVFTRLAPALMVLLCVTTANAQNSSVQWSTFDMGFSAVRGGNTLALSDVGQGFVGDTHTGNAQVFSGFLADPWLLGPVVSVADGKAIPVAFSLSQNFPNPFNPSTRIRFALPHQSYVKLTLYNILGQVVMTPVDGMRQAGEHEIILDARGLASGVYFYRIHASADNGADFVDLKKLIVLK